MYKELKAQYIGSCIENPFGDLETLNSVIEDAKSITKETFLKNAEFDTFLYGDKNTMQGYPNDFQFFHYKKGDLNIYFFTHSCTEFFYQK